MKGILFRPEMIQAILNNSKTQTRRIIKRGSKSDPASYDYYAKKAKSRYHAGEVVSSKPILDK